MKLIVGLGNPTQKYEKTRHNVGFILINDFHEARGLHWEPAPKFDAEICVSENFILLKPQTFMNNSGKAVSKALNYYKIKPSDLLVVHDDVDLPQGTIRKQIGSGAAGHHGVEDIINEIGTKDFWRLRVGVGRPENNNIPVDVYVLDNFADSELVELRKDVGVLKMIEDFVNAAV